MSSQYPLLLPPSQCMSWYDCHKKENCDWCQQTAVNVVGKMTQWRPALKNGKPVPVELVIPIKFLG